MNELIKVTTNENGDKLVSAKELYLGLGMAKSNWSKWHKKNIFNNEYFKENVDWVGVSTQYEGNETMDYAINLEFAKHIAMMARTEKSHEYRNYFIQCEKQLQQQNNLLPKDYLSALKQLVVSEEQRQKLLEENEKNKPKVAYFNELVERNLLTNFRDTAKELKVREKDFINWLLEEQYIFRDAKKKLKPYGKYVPDLFELKEWANYSKAGTQTLITPKGRETFRLLIKGI